MLNIHLPPCRWLACVCAWLLAVFSGLAQTGKTDFSIAPPPAWVETIEPETPRPPAPAQVSEGEFLVLLDRQINAVQREQFIHISKIIVNESGVQNGSRISVSFDPSYQQLTFHHIRIRRGAAVLDRLDATKIKVIQQERELERHLYNGAMSAVLFLEDVRAGDSIEYAYTMRGENPVLAGHYLDSFMAQWRIPVQRERYRLLWPTTRPLHIKNHHTEVRPIVTDQAGLKQYVWDLKDLPALLEEDSLPVGFDPYPWVQVGDFASWSEVAQWAAKLYQPVGPLSAEMLAQVDTWKKNKAEPESRLLAALQFVQDEVRYLGLEFGPYSHQPTAPSIVFARRFGDCKDKSLLLCEILRAMDIEAVPALVSTSYRHAVEQWQPSPYAFNHVVTRVTLGGQFYWVDPTRSNQRGPLKSRYFSDYGRALMARPDTSALTQIPASTSGLPKTTTVEKFAFTKFDGTSEITVTTTAEGADADYLRATMASIRRDELEKHYINYYARRYPKIAPARPLEVQDHADQNVIRTTERYIVTNLWSLTQDQQKDRQHWFGEFYPEDIRNAVAKPETTLRSTPLGVRAFP